MEYLRCTKNEWLILSGISVRPVKPVMIYISVIDYISITKRLWKNPEILHKRSKCKINWKLQCYRTHCFEWFIQKVYCILFIKRIARQNVIVLNFYFTFRLKKFDSKSFISFLFSWHLLINWLWFIKTYFTPDIDAHCCEWFILLILYIRAILFNKMQTMNGSWIEREK